MQIAAHARWINALEVHPNGALFCTAAEDAVINVWEFLEPLPGGVRHVSSIPVPDALLCGVAFTGGQERTHVSCAAYDVGLVMSFKM